MLSAGVGAGASAVEVDDALRDIWHRLGKLRAQRSLLEIVVTEQAEAVTVVPSGEGQWESASKQSYVAALSELRSGMNVVGYEASAALTAVHVAIAAAEDEEQEAGLRAASAPDAGMVEFLGR